MKRWALWLALFLSLGFNLGLVVGHLTPGGVPDSPVSDDPIGHPGDTEVERPSQGEPRGDDPLVQDQPLHVPPRLQRIVVRVADELGLEGTERQRFFDLQREFFRRTKQARRLQRSHEFELRRLLIADDAGRAEVEEALARVIGAQSQLEQAFLDHYFDARQLLDLQQMRRYRHFLGQLRRASQEMARRELSEPRDPGRMGRMGRRPIR
ncbi:MAG: periplasmic heavy metal sensor [Thermoanaerobaculia bacterium]|nr:periplasmic heavy metal sensor [Thermoanaerobaculia bacterium]